MDIKKLNLEGLLIIKPKIFKDNRGCFFESFNLSKFNIFFKKKYSFVQDNFSLSKKNVLRGLHFQIKKPQAKLVQVLEGIIFDVVVDLRQKSHSFGKWEGLVLDAKKRELLWIPENFAHGFLVLSKKATVHYKTTEFYYPELEKNIIWNDPTINIKWNIKREPILSEKDSKAQYFKEIFRI